MSPLAEKILALLVDGYRAEPEDGSYYRLVKRAPDVAPGNAGGVTQAIRELDAAGYLDFAANGSCIAWLSDKGRAAVDVPPKRQVPWPCPVTTAACDRGCDIACQLASVPVGRMQRVISHYDDEAGQWVFAENWHAIEGPNGQCACGPEKGKCGDRLAAFVNELRADVPPKMDVPETRECNRCAFRFVTEESKWCPACGSHDTRADNAPKVGDPK